MICGATGETFRDMIAKVVFEHERVCADNIQLQRAIVALQANALAPVATIPSESKTCPNPLWSRAARSLPSAPVLPPGEPDLPAVISPQEAPRLSDGPAPQDSTVPEERMPSTKATAFVPCFFTQPMEEPGAGSWTEAGETNLGQSSHSARWSLHAVESQYVQEATGTDTPTASRHKKMRRKRRFLVSQSDSTFAPVASRRHSGRFTVQKSLSNFEKQGGSSTTLISFALPESWKRLFSESRCVLSFKRIVRGPAFNLFFAFVVVAYAAFIGYEASWVARNLQQQSIDFDIAHGIFNIIFLVELVMRFAADGQRFFLGEAWRWNALDVVLVLASAVDFLILRNHVHVSHSGGIRTVRFARILRPMRTIRIIRIVKSIHELHKMLYSVLSSMRTLLCASLVLAFVMYFFSILFTVAAAEQRSMNLEANDPLQIFYGTFGRTFRSLFWAMSNGMSWSAMYEAIAEIHWTYGLCFFMYIIIVIFGVLNVVTSVFVESAFLSAQFYRDLIIKDKEYEKAVASGHILAVFRQMDQKGNGQISSDEMEFFLGDPELRQYLEALDLSADDTRMLFRLLDEDSSGLIDMDEFCSGCLKLKGDAKSIDVHILMLQMQRFLTKWSDFTEYVEDQFSAIDMALLSSEKLQPKTKDNL